MRPRKPEPQSIGPWAFGPDEHGRFMGAMCCARCGHQHMTSYFGTRDDVKAAARKLATECDHKEMEAKSDE